MEGGRSWRVRGRERDLPGFQAIHPCLCPALATPAEPTIPRLLDGFVDAVPALPTAKTSALNEFRGSVTRLWHPLPTLQESCCHHPCKARFRLARLASTGRASNPLDRCKRFQIIHPPFLDLAWRKGSFILNLPSHYSITSSARASSVGGKLQSRVARQSHGKHRPLPRFACHGHVATHHARELAREGKAEPRPAVAARGE
jgi:hypothetical protein